ncbi:MAG: hypothetical protein ACXVEF_18740 [Polyangiales bacterium]
MARARLGESFDVKLPSGRVASVCAKVAEPRPRDVLQAIERGLVSLPNDLALCDANVIEAILAELGAIEKDRVPLACRNCGEKIELVASLPIEPLLDPPGDEELDRPGAWDRLEWHDFPAPIEVGRRGTADRFQLGRRTLADRARLESMLGDTLPIGAPLVRAVGIVALARGEVEVTKSPTAIARALESLDDDAFDDAWDAIGRAYDEQHWPPRLLAAVPCPSCGARHDVEAVRRPLEWIEERARVEGGPFPSFEAFRDRAATIAREVFTATGLEAITDVEVIVEDDVPPCDDGGEPLLGSYTPSGGIGLHVIALYYRTFRSMYEDEPYDVDAEIRETIDHELEHHVGFLRGDDPLDDEERAEIVRERVRRLGLSPKTPQEPASIPDFVRFVRSTWPIWFAALLLILILISSTR